MAPGRALLPVLLACMTACSNGTQPAASTTTATAPAPETTAAALPTSTTTASAPAEAVVLHVYNVHLDSAGEPGSEHAIVVVDSNASSVSVTLTGGAPSAYTAMRVCPVVDVTEPVTTPSTSGCLTPAPGRPMIVARTSTSHGVEMLRIRGSGSSGIDLTEVRVSYVATDRTVTVGLPNQAPPPGASVCKDNGCNPFVELTPRRAGRFTATASWSGISSAALDLETGAIAAHSYSGHGVPYQVLASAHGDSSTAPGELHIVGTLDAAAEAAAALRNTGARPMLSPRLDITWP